MAEHFVEHLEQQRFPEHVVNAIQQRLEEAHYDIEDLIDEMDCIERGDRASKLWRIEGRSATHDAVGNVRREAEWFLMHICERVDPRKARCLWLPLFRQLGHHELTIATTNYDRAIEIAAAELSTELYDGFGPFESNEYTEWKGFPKTDSPSLLKLHGSTDWYHSDNGRKVWKLRHAMPLFGALTLRTGANPSLDLGSAAVLPSREKKVILAPYPELMYEFQQAARQVDVVMFVGTSLRDADIRSVCEKAANRVPTWFVSRRDSIENFVPDKVRHIRQSASYFVVSTLAHCLKASTPDEAARVLDKAPAYTDSVLAPLVLIAGEGNKAEERCGAIEKLASVRIGLFQGDIEPLFRDPNAEIRVYALGLVQDSPDRDSLLLIARTIAAEQPDSPFAKETQMLAKLIDILDATSADAPQRTAAQ
jgi:hypothetical protein